MKRRMTLAGLGCGLPGPAGGLDNMGGGREGGMGVTPTCPPTGSHPPSAAARALMHLHGRCPVLPAGSPPSATPTSPAPVGKASEDPACCLGPQPLLPARGSGVH